MPNTAPPSFIPHESPSVAAAPRGSNLVDLFILISLVLFVASAALAAGIFLYQQYLQASATSKVEQLERAKAAFEPSLIHELSRLDDRMRAAGDVLSRHMAPSAFFTMLEQTTIETLSFSSLDFEAVDTGHLTVKMSGIAKSVNSIALQADLYAKGGMVTNPIFSNIDREQDGVHFNLAALINPTAINFVQLSAAGAAVPPQAATVESGFSAPAPSQGEGTQ